MSTDQTPPSSSITSTSTTLPSVSASSFTQQRTQLLQEISVSFEHVLANINRLNRSLEGVVAVGNEFSSVEALWSTFENLMVKTRDDDGEGGGDLHGGGGGDTGAEQGRDENAHDDITEEGIDGKKRPIGR